MTHTEYFENRLSKRKVIEEKLLALDAKVEVWDTDELLVNDRYIVRSDKKKWCVKGKDKWYGYKSIPELYNLYINPSTPVFNNNKPKGDWTNYELRSEGKYRVYVDNGFNGSISGDYVYIYALGVHEDYRNTELLIEDRMHEPWDNQFSQNMVYVGSTVNPVERIQDHYHNGSGKVMQEWISSLRMERKKPFMRLLKRVNTNDRLNYEAQYCKLLYDRIRQNILNRSLLPELQRDEYKLDLEPFFDWDIENGCYAFGK